MPAMKLTPNAAMRARDVSRPRAEHLAEAEAAEAKENTGRGGPAPDGAETARAEASRAETDGAQTGKAETGRASEVAGDDRAGRPGLPRRRRGPRDVKRRGRPSR